MKSLRGWIDSMGRDRQFRVGIGILGPSRGRIPQLHDPRRPIVTRYSKAYRVRETRGGSNPPASGYETKRLERPIAESITVPGAEVCCRIPGRGFPRRRLHCIALDQLDGEKRPHAQQAQPKAPSIRCRHVYRTRRRSPWMACKARQSPLADGGRV